ncbi:hypothetical protein AB0B28_19995 [Glycomyces sp. NPDC046736]
MRPARTALLDGEAHWDPSSPAAGIPGPVRPPARDEPTDPINEES